MNILLAVLGAFVFCGFRVSAVCNSLTQQKLQECSLNSHMFDPEMSPKSHYRLRKFCEEETHHIVACYNTHVEECAHNQKESDLLKILTDIKGMRRGFDYLCGNMSVVERNPQCLDKLQLQRLTQCEQRDMASFKRRIMGVGDMKRRLDELCGFFESLRYCFTQTLRGECEDIGHLYDTFLQSFKYPYCKMSDRERRRHVDEYTGRSEAAKEPRGHTDKHAIKTEDYRDDFGVSRHCDAMTQQKIQECSMNSHLLDPQMSPKSEYHLRQFCEKETHNIVSCINNHVKECIHNEKEKKIINMVVDIKGMNRGFEYLCGNISVLQRKSECLDEFKKPSFSQCEHQSIYNFKRRIMGVSDMKRRLDELCSFFDSFRLCFTNPFRGECEVVGHLYGTFLLSFKYPYCKMSDSERRRRVEEYTRTPERLSEEADAANAEKVEVHEDLKTFYHYRKSNAGVTLKHNAIVLLVLATISRF